MAAGRADALDPLDRQVLGALLADARRSYADVGDAVGLSASAVKRRVDRLREAGIVTGFTVRVSPEALGWATEAYVSLFYAGRTRPDVLREHLARLPEVVEVVTVTGAADALVHVVTAGTAQFEDVLQRISDLPFVARTESSIVLSRLVDRERVVDLGERLGATASASGRSLQTQQSGRAHARPPWLEPRRPGRSTLPPVAVPRPPPPRHVPPRRL